MDRHDAVTTPDSPDTAALLRWDGGEALRLTHISAGPKVLFPEMEDLWLDKGWFDPRTTRRALAVLGEQGSGATSLINWLKARAAVLGRPVRVLDGRAGLDEWAHELGVDRTDPFAHALRWVSTAAEAPPILVLHHLEHLPIDQVISILARLRAAVERGLAPGARVVLVGQDADVLSVGPYSNIVSAVDVARPAWFTSRELGELIIKVRPGSIQDANAATRACLESTGGHPLLSQQFLLQLRRGGTAEEAARWLQYHPPTVLADWRGQLASIVTRHRSASTLASRLSASATAAEARISADTAPLCLSGWIGRVELDGVTRWRMSRAHKEWAKPVLLNPARYLPGGVR